MENSSYPFPIPESWQVCEFGDILTEDGTRNGIYKPKKYHGKGVKVVNMGELFAYERIGAQPMKRIQLTEQEKQKLLLKPGDLLFARRSLVASGAGKCSLIVDLAEPTTFKSSIIRARPDCKVVDPRYLYYLFLSPLGKYLMGTILRQVAVAGITSSDLVKLPIPVPALTVQKEIANVLSSFDDKIQLNHRMNQTLEEIARTLFKSWFVNFDPVRAKAEGRDPGLPADIAHLFPNSLKSHSWARFRAGGRLEQ